MAIPFVIQSAALLIGQSQDASMIPPAKMKSADTVTKGGQGSAGAQSFMAPHNERIRVFVSHYCQQKRMGASQNNQVRL
jgi:hypothetical protein